MQYLRWPPKIKVLEAAGAIADERIKLIDDNHALITSSTGERTYVVYVDLEKREACSTDNGTVYRGYVGYPILSLLMLKGILTYDERIGKALKGIPWKELNEKFKKYDLVLEEIKKIASEKGVPPEELEAYKEEVYSQVRRLRLRRNDSECRNLNILH